MFGSGKYKGKKNVKKNDLLHFLSFYFSSLFSFLRIFPQIFREPNIALRKIYIVKYPTSNAAENLVFKLRHAMGDGFSPMGALLYCLLRADTTNLLRTFLSFKVSANLDSEKSIIKQCQEFFSWTLDMVSDFGWSLLKRVMVEDDRTIWSSWLAIKFERVFYFMFLLEDYWECD